MQRGSVPTRHLYAASHSSPRLIYSLNQSAVHDWPGHPETADRVVSIQKQLADVLSTDHHDHLELPLENVQPASLEDILLVHDERYVPAHRSCLRFRPHYCTLTRALHPLARYLAALRDKASEAMSVSGLMLDESTVRK